MIPCEGAGMVHTPGKNCANLLRTDRLMKNTYVIGVTSESAYSIARFLEAELRVPSRSRSMHLASHPPPRQNLWKNKKKQSEDPPLSYLAYCELAFGGNTNKLGII